MARDTGYAWCGARTIHVDARSVVLSRCAVQAAREADAVLLFREGAIMQRAAQHASLFVF